MSDVVSESLGKFSKKTIEKASQFEKDKGVRILGLGVVKKARRGVLNKKLEQRLMNRMGRFAILGDRASYDKVEKILGRLQAKRSRSKPTKPGEIWDKLALRRKSERGRKYYKVVKELRKELELAALRGDRDGYGRIESKLSKVKSKAGSKFGDNEIVKQGGMWDRYKDKLPSKLGQTLARPGSNIKMDVQDLYELTLTSIVRGNKLQIEVHPDSLSFTVNGSYLAKGNLPLRDKIAIVKELKKQFPEVVKNFGEGRGLYVIAAEGDNKDEMRRGAYIDFGFAPPDSKGLMYGVIKDGKVKASDEREFRRSYVDEF